MSSGCYCWIYYDVEQVREVTIPSPVGEVAERKAADQEADVESRLVHVDPPSVRTHQVKLRQEAGKNQKSDTSAQRRAS